MKLLIILLAGAVLGGVVGYATSVLEPSLGGVTFGNEYVATTTENHVTGNVVDFTLRNGWGSLGLKSRQRLSSSSNKRVK